MFEWLTTDVAYNFLEATISGYFQYGLAYVGWNSLSNPVTFVVSDSYMYMLLCIFISHWVAFKLKIAQNLVKLDATSAMVGYIVNINVASSPRVR